MSAKEDEPAQEEAAEEQVQEITPEEEAVWTVRAFMTETGPASSAGAAAGRETSKEARWTCSEQEGRSRIQLSQGLKFLLVLF